MHSNEYEKKFKDFLESGTYERAEGDFFDCMRAAYEAGWLAAGGEQPKLREALAFKKPKR